MSGPEPVLHYYRVGPRAESMDALEDQVSPSSRAWNPSIDRFVKKERHHRSPGGRVVWVVGFAQAHSVPQGH
jgi:hypothetical protein